MPITWNIPLVSLSVFIAVLGSFTALTHAQRMRENTGPTATLWMLAGGSTLGIAIWSMHFVGMLAFHLPIPIGFDIQLTALSLIPAVIAALLGFHVLRVVHVKPRRILYSGILMGAGISAMHYMGMDALKMSPDITYEPWIFALSIVIAILASWGAMLIMYRQDWVKLATFPRTVLGSVVMGLAISSMHYTAMLGMHIPEGGMCLTDALRIEPNIMAAMLTLTALIWFGGGLLANLFDQRMARKNSQELADLEQAHRVLTAQSEQVSESMIQALRESEDRLRMTLQNAPDAVFITEQSGRIVYVNDNVVELLGYDREELYAKTVFDLVPEHWREAYKFGGKQIISTNKRQVFEIRLVTKDGTKIPMELNAVLLPNGRVYGSCRDIRERKAAQLALEESRLNLQRMMDSITEGMYGVDTQGNCTFVNQAFLNLLGFDNADEVLGKHIHTLIHHSHADGKPYPASECIMYQAFKIDQPVNTDQEVFWRKDGVAVPVEYWSHPIFKDGKAIGAVATFLDISERKEKELHIHQLAFYDALTNLPNRRLLMERAQQALAVSVRNGRYGALMLLDMDNFKKLNDSKGHDVGDMLLREVALRLQSSIREGDTVARLGGDEFVVMLEGLSEHMSEAVVQAEIVAEKIREALAQPYLLKRLSGMTSDADTITHHCSSSIGVTIFRDHDESLEQLLKWTDMAMYRAKEAGRNAIRFFDPAMQTAIETRAALENDLHAALELGQFELYYQVQVNANRRPQGAEVLLRWIHPERGLISPAQFIPLAEETGLILPIGAWVMDTACAQIKRWEEQLSFRNLSLAVNVSAKQFRQPDFVAQVQSAIVRNSINPMSLKLELTESLVLDNVADTIAKMCALKDIGVSFSMDDFGTGYSSLSYLKRLPLSQLKIDQSFVRDLATDQGDKVMVMTIVDLGMNFEVDVIAEGVETEAQFNLLHHYGCTSFQGYLFSQPVPVDEFESLVANKLLESAGTI